MELKLATDVMHSLGAPSDSPNPIINFPKLLKVDIYLKLCSIGREGPACFGTTLVNTNPPLRHEAEKSSNALGPPYSTKVTTLEFLVSNGQMGAAVAYKRATGAQQTYFVTDGFVTAYPTVAQMILVCSSQPGNRWKMLESEDEVATMANNFANKGRLAELLVFASQREYKHKPAAPQRGQ